MAVPSFQVLPVVTLETQKKLNHEEHPELNKRTYLTGQAKKKIKMQDAKYTIQESEDRIQELCFMRYAHITPPLRYSNQKTMLFSFYIRCWTFDVHVARCVGDVRSFCSNTRPHYLYGQNTFRKRTQKNVLTGEV
jgi:hypothetical protein